MRFRVERQSWIIGQWSIPPTTEIDLSKPGQWNEIVRGKVPPLNALACDQEAYDLMFNSYLWGGRDAIHVGPGVVRRSVTSKRNY